MPSKNSELARDIQRIEQLADLLDTRLRIPIIGYRVGLDGLIGLLPGIGDLAGWGLSLYLIAKAYQLGVRKRVLLAMLGNAAFDFFLGLVPLIGDILDFANKSNARNARLILSEYEAGRLHG
jgi:hypothetical protein